MLRSQPGLNTICVGVIYNQHLKLNLAILHLVLTDKIKLAYILTSDRFLSNFYLILYSTSLLTFEKYIFWQPTQNIFLEH